MNVNFFDNFLKLIPMFKNKIKKKRHKNMFEFFEAKGENCIKGRLVQGNVKIYPSIPKMANLF
jgi:hypothetical protein